MLQRGTLSKKACKGPLCKEEICQTRKSTDRVSGQKRRDRTITEQ